MYLGIWILMIRTSIKQELNYCDQKYLQLAFHFLTVSNRRPRLVRKAASGLMSQTPLGKNLTHKGNTTLHELREYLQSPNTIRSIMALNSLWIKILSPPPYPDSRFVPWWSLSLSHRQCDSLYIHNFYILWLKPDRGRNPSISWKPIDMQQVIGHQSLYTRIIRCTPWVRDGRILS